MMSPGGGYRGRGGRGGRGRGGASSQWRGGAFSGSKRGRYNDESNSDSEEKNTYMGRIRQLFMSIGDKGAYEKHITQLSQALIDDIAVDQPENGEEPMMKDEQQPIAAPASGQIISDIVSVILDCVCNIPGKVSVYGTVAGLIAARRKSFVKLLLTNLRDRYVKAVSKCDWRRCKVLTRFACELMNSNVIEADDIFHLYEPLVTQVQKALDSSSCDLITDNFVHVIIGSIPYGFTKLNSTHASEVTQMLNKIGNYMYIRAKYLYKRNNLCFSHVFWEEDESQLSSEEMSSSEYRKDYLEIIWEALSGKTLPEIDEEEDISMSNYEEEDSFSIPDIIAYSSYSKMFESQLSDNQLQVFKCDYSLPEIPCSKVYGGHLGVFEQIALSGDIPSANITREDLPSYLDRTIINELVSDHLHVNILSTQRLNVQKVVQDLIVKCIKSKNLDTPDDEVQKKAQIITVCLLADSILGHMFILPSSPTKIQYYCALVSELISTETDNVIGTRNKTIFDLFIQKCFDLLPSMDIECVTNRFAAFFAYYLFISNFTWDWEAWNQYLSIDESTTLSYPMQLRRTFVRQTLNKLYRMSSITDVNRCIHNKSGGAENANDMKPYDFLRDLVPPNAVPSFKFSEENTNIEASTKKDVQDILNAFKESIAANEMSKIVANLLESGKSRADIIEMLMQSLLLMSSKSITQIQNYLDIYGPVIIDLATEKTEMSDAESDNSRTSITTQYIIVRSIWEFWKESPQFCSVILQKFLAYGKSLLALQSVISWLFQHGQENQHVFLKNVTGWEMIRGGLEAVLARSLSAFESGDSSTSKSSIHEIQESVLLAIQKLLQVLLTGSSDDKQDWLYRSTLSYLVELLRCWQQFVPQQSIQELSESTIENYQTDANSPKQLTITNILKLSEYYQTWRSNDAETQEGTSIMQQIPPNDDISGIVKQIKDQTYVYNNINL